LAAFKTARISPLNAPCFYPKGARTHHTEQTFEGCRTANFKC